MIAGAKSCQNISKPCFLLILFQQQVYGFVPFTVVNAGQLCLVRFLVIHLYLFDRISRQVFRGYLWIAAKKLFPVNQYIPDIFPQGFDVSHPVDLYPGHLPDQILHYSIRFGTEGSCIIFNCVLLDQERDPFSLYVYLFQIQWNRFHHDCPQAVPG